MVKQAREQAQIARDYAENLRLLSAATAVPPDVLDLLGTMQRQIGDLQARVAALEGRPRGPSSSADPPVGEDGKPRLSGRWMRLKQAARASGYSVSGLRKLCDRGRCTFDYSGPHRVINVASIPRRVVKVRKVPS
jgi:hypothetical protein